LQKTSIGAPQSEKGRRKKGISPGFQGKQAEHPEERCANNLIAAPVEK
jgi:hypothetical protein